MDQFSAKTISGDEKSLGDYRGKVLLIVNTATKCGFTSQFKSLQPFYETDHNQGFEVLGFPCNQFGNQDLCTNEETASFCKQNYKITFPMFRKVNVKGNGIHPLFAYVTIATNRILTKPIKWNFTQFLINKEGKVIRRYAPQTKPKKYSKRY